MNTETEIKLRVSRETLAALREHPLLKKRIKSGWESHPLANQYFDTAEQALAAARVALRIRKDGEQYIQTLKTRGRSVAGLSQRGEWEWPLAKPRLDLKKLDDQCWPQSLAKLDKKQLKPLFSTDFVREKAELAWGRGKSKTVIEAALDLGEVKAGKLREEICELELELRQGEPAALLELASELAASLPLMPCDVSKSERGYRLLNPDNLGLRGDSPELDAEQSLDNALALLAGHLLGNSQRLAEQYRFSGHWRLLVDWLAQLTDLRALLGSLGQAAPRASSRELRQHLDALLQDWRPRVLAGSQDDTQRQSAPAIFAEELQSTRWGLFSLQAAAWLHGRHWTLERNKRGERQGAAPLGNWLLNLLAEEAVAMQLERYKQHPEELADQLPRMERMLVWLRLARGVLLTLPETDRLYGELRKLHELALDNADEATLNARATQAHSVWTLKAWKALSR